MSEYKVQTPGRKRMKTPLARQILFQYLLSVALFTVALPLLALVCVILASSRTWYGTEPLYQLLTWARDYFFLVFAAAYAAGFLVITIYFIRKPLRFLDELVSASAQLANLSEEPIQLPAAMKGAEDQLNLVRQQALHSAAAAREAEQRKNDLIVYLAHDLKTPLTSVIGYLTLLRDEPQISPELRSRYTGIALEKAERLEDLINEFFDITRFNLSHLTLEVSRVDLSLMLEQACSEFAPIFAEKDLSCQLDVPPKLECSCDPDKLARVFDNLLRNACHYSFPHTSVQVAAREEDGRLTLTFENEGPTIPREKLDRIFEQFFRLDSSRGTRTGGAGLGLAIARQIAELHGGSITAASAENHIRFTVVLPQFQKG